MANRLPAEWEPQDAVLMAWPHAATDWRPYLDEVAAVFGEIIRHIIRFERAVIVTPEPTALSAKLGHVGIDLTRLELVAALTNDTWARDFGPLTIYCDDQPQWLDFMFNGWGLKFAANHDNCVSRRLHEHGSFRHLSRLLPGLVLEGGSIESDGRGTILTTAACLLSENRNPHLSQVEVEHCLGEWLGAERVLWLNNGFLAGDDTDSHIDTLARFCPDNTIAYVSCDDPQDLHYAALNRMAAELAEFRNAAGHEYRLIPLPWPAACYDDDGERLPATYANFLIINQAVLVPIYGVPQDAAAMIAIGAAFPGREIIGINCRPLIRQHGSLHCVTMQLPSGVLSCRQN